MLTCYSLFERDSEQSREDRKFVHSFRWSHLIMDEASANLALLPCNTLSSHARFEVGELSQGCSLYGERPELHGETAPWV